MNNCNYGSDFWWKNGSQLCYFPCVCLVSPLHGIILSFTPLETLTLIRGGNVVITQRPQFITSWRPGIATVTWNQCNGPGFADGSWAYYREYIAWVVFPKKVMTQNGYPLFIEVHNKGSWSEENTGDNDSYFFLKGISGMSGPLIQLICVRNQEKQPVWLRNLTILFLKSPYLQIFL